MVLNDFDSTIYNYVEDFVSKIDYSDDDYSRVTSSELVGLVGRLKEGTSSGEDGIHNLFLKNLSQKGLNLLLKMINLSLDVCLPDAWKSAVITMIPKKE